MPAIEPSSDSGMRKGMAGHYNDDRMPFRVASATVTVVLAVAKVFTVA